MEGLDEWLPPILCLHEVGTETGLQVAQVLIEIFFRLGQVFGRG
jgi:hypothetical protein